MSSRSTRSEGRGTKRARTTDDDQQDDGSDGQRFKRDDGDGGQTQPRGQPQLLITTEELRKRVGKKYCDETELVPLLLSSGLLHRADESELVVFRDDFLSQLTFGSGSATSKSAHEAVILPLMLAHGLVEHTHTIALEVRPLSGESFDIKLDASEPTVGEAKEQIERDEGTQKERQLLCRVQVSADGSNVREFDQEPEELKEDEMALAEGDVIAMGVIDEVKWRTWPAETTQVSADGKLARYMRGYAWSLACTGEELMEGRHYWEVEITSIEQYGLYVGICRPDTDPRSYPAKQQHTTAWFMSTNSGGLYGNGKFRSDRATGFHRGDRMGILVDLDDGSLHFFRNGVEHGPGWPAGSVTGPVALATLMCESGSAVRLLPAADWPAGHA